MRYLLHQSKSAELAARSSYLYDIFHLYFQALKPENGFIPLQPVGHSEPDYLFITGHTDDVRRYLNKQIFIIPEKTIIITSCIGSAFTQFTSVKEIYVPNQKTPFCEIRNGQPYGFGFDISDPELDFYNASGTIADRLNAAYVRLK